MNSGLVINAARPAFAVHTHTRTLTRTLRARKKFATDSCLVVMTPGNLEIRIFVKSFLQRSEKTDTDGVAKDSGSPTPHSLHHVAYLV